MANSKIRHIKLVPETDESYSQYLADLKLERFHLRKGNQRSFADLISFPVECAVREWVKRGGTAIDERILSFESLNKNNRYEKRFNEIDFVFVENGVHFLGELKVSSSDRAITKASGQLRNNYRILTEEGYEIELLIVHVDLNHKNSETPFEPFDEDFSKVQFSFIDEEKELPLNLLHLEPSGIFEWGVKNGIIQDDTLLEKAVAEADDLHAKRIKRQELTDQGIPREDWPDELKKENKLEDEGTHMLSFGDESKPNLLADKLMEALKKGNK